jgi:hypothetical protein
LAAVPRSCSQIDHRESHDIDLFLGDPQILPFLNPETQEIELERRPDSYQTDGTRVLKLAYQDFGEIDFICAASITEDPTTGQKVRGNLVQVERPSEIIAKKVHYRGSSFQPRDMFDLAAVIECRGMDYAVDALRQCGIESCKRALEAIEKAKPDFAASIMNQLMVKDEMRHLIARAQGMGREVLERTLSSIGHSSS